MDNEMKAGDIINWIGYIGYSEVIANATVEYLEGLKSEDKRLEIDDSTIYNLKILEVTKEEMIPVDTKDKIKYKVMIKGEIALIKGDKNE